MCGIFANGSLEYFNLVGVDQYASNNSAYNAPIGILSHDGLDSVHQIRFTPIHRAHSLRARLHVGCFAENPPCKEVYS